MADWTGINSDEASQLGLPTTAGDVQGLASAAQNDPFAVWWAMFTGQDSANSGGAGNLVSRQGGGFNPTQTGNEAGALAGSFGLERDIRNAGALNDIYQRGVAAAPRANPYNAQVADQSRASQLALIQQMRGQMNGPSLAGLQGQRGMAQMGQQALMQGGRAGMLGAAQAAGGLAGDTAQARAAEIMRAQAGMGGAAGNLRGADLRSAEAQSQAALQQRGQDDAMQRFYAQQALQLQNARNQALANREVTRLNLLTKSNTRDMQNMQNMLGYTANMAGGIATGGGKK